MTVGTLTEEAGSAALLEAFLAMNTSGLSRSETACCQVGMRRCGECVSLCRRVEWMGMFVCVMCV